jgi:hypothetical protein
VSGDRPARLFAEAEPNRDRAERRGSLPHGPPGLLKALIQQGLREEALEVAAALVLALDAGAAPEPEVE